METQLKQRLVGIAVIFSLAVIFLPMLLDGSGRGPEKLDITMPPVPDLSSDVRVEQQVIELKKKAATLPRLKPLLVDEISDPVEAEMTVETDQKQPLNADPVVINEKNKSQAESLQGQDNQIRQVKKQELQQKPAETTQKEASKPKVGGQAWVIQVGSFQDKSKAYKERDRLRKSKLSAVFIERFENNRVPSYRVRMGPFLTLDKARVVNNKILAKYSIKGLVMSYEK